MNLEIAERIYSKKGEHMCVNDGYVCFRNSELICGRMGKVGGRGGARWGGGAGTGRVERENVAWWGGGKGGGRRGVSAWGGRGNILP